MNRTGNRRQGADHLEIEWPRKTECQMSAASFTGHRMVGERKPAPIGRGTVMAINPSCSGAERITRALSGTWYGRYGMAFCPAHANTATPALSLADGDDGRLLAKCFAGCTFQRILDALRLLNLVETPSRGARNGHHVPVPYKALRKGDFKQRSARARRVWAECRSIEGTRAADYLDGRAIRCALPSTLRFHPFCWHASGNNFPSLVALVEGSAAFAVHRTYLDPVGQGIAAIRPAKAMLGPVAGGAVRLSETSSGPLVVCEGIETGLSLVMRLPKSTAVWAALSTSGLKALNLPKQPRELILAPDGDSPGLRAAGTLADRAQRLGWQVRMMLPPVGQDWNDVLRETDHG